MSKLLFALLLGGVRGGDCAAPLVDFFREKRL